MNSIARNLRICHSGWLDNKLYVASMPGLHWPQGFAVYFNPCEWDSDFGASFLELNLALNYISVTKFISSDK